MDLSEVEEVLKQVQAMQAVEEDETKPFDQKYAAADLLKKEYERLSAQHGDSQSTSLQKAVLQARRGLLLLETDLLADGEACVTTALVQLETAQSAGQTLSFTSSTSGATCPAISAVTASSQPDTHAAETTATSEAAQEQCQEAPGCAGPMLEGSPEGACSTVSSTGSSSTNIESLTQECYNALGALYSQRGDFETSIKWLEKALKMYESLKAQIKESKQQATLEASPQQSPGTSTQDASAQAAGHQSLAARLAALEAGYTASLFYMAQVQGHAGRRDRSALYCAATLQRQLAAGEYKLNDWVQNCLQLGSYYISENAFALGQYCIEAAEQLAEQQKEKQALDDDVRANIHLAWAKMYLCRLVASHAMVLEGIEPTMPYPGVEHFPDLLSLPSLAEHLPNPSSLPWGKAALATDFPAARDLFNFSMTHFKAALEFYQLDGWVTEHVHAQLDVCNLCRLLAGFEPDASRRVAIHKLRASKLEPLHGKLSPTHFLGLSRSIDLELGNAWRDALESKLSGSDAEEKGGSVKGAAALASAATRYYTAFIDSFRPDANPQAPLPARVDEDNERIFLLASFSLGRVLHRCGVSAKSSTSEIEVMAKAYKHLEWTSSYVKHHGVTEFAQEAELARQLAELVGEKIKLVQRLAAAEAKAK